MRRFNVRFLRVNPNDPGALEALATEWLEHREVSLPLIEGARDGAFEFKDSRLILGTDNTGEQVVASFAHWPEKVDFQHFFEDTPEGATLKEDIVRRWGKFEEGWGQWQGDWIKTDRLLAGIEEEPYVAVFGHKSIAQTAFPTIAHRMVGQIGSVWQAELFLARGNQDLAGISLITLDSEASWAENETRISNYLAELGLDAQQMGRLWTPELPDLQHKHYVRAFSQTERGVRFNSLPA